MLRDDNGRWENIALAAFTAVRKNQGTLEWVKECIEFREAFRSIAEQAARESLAGWLGRREAMRRASLQFRYVYFTTSELLYNGKPRIHERKPGTESTLCGREFTPESSLDDKTKPTVKNMQGVHVKCCRVCKKLGGFSGERDLVLHVDSVSPATKSFKEQQRLEGATSATATQ